MSANEENVSRILLVLSHPIRRQILLTLNEKGECTFTDLLNALKVDTGKLSFHIRNLDDLVEQTKTGKYKLSRSGDNAIRLIKDLETWTVEINATKKASLVPLATFKKRTFAFLIDFGIAFAIFLALPDIFIFFTRGPESILGLDVNFLSLILFWVYLTLLEGFAGQSLGKRVVGLMVVRVDGKKVFYDHAAVRNFSKGFFFLLPIDLLIGLKLKDPNFIRYFDKFAGTTVKDLRA